MYSRASFLRGYRFPIQTCRFRPITCPGTPLFQYRGVKIRREVHNEEMHSAERDMERSYNLLLSETEWDMREEAFNARQEGESGEKVEQSPLGQWDRFKQKYHYPQATHTLRTLEYTALGDTVVIHGYLRNSRVISKRLAFATLFDHSGGRPIQLISYINNHAHPDEFEVHAKVADCKAFTPVAVVGQLRQKDMPKVPDFKPVLKDVEIAPKAIYILNDVAGHHMFTKDATFTMAERHLQLRTDRKLQQALRLRASVAASCRDELRSQGFLEVETPLLFKSTPEGAREFLVPTRQPGLMYALPQSPQQYKQILMASGVPKYYQFAKCFRDEDLRADRQPEFTQLDLEMSFAGAHNVMSVITRLIKRIWYEKRHNSIDEIPQLSYAMAIGTYGSDKPDLRYSHSLIRDVTSVLPHLTNGKTDMIVEAFALELSDNTTEQHLVAMDVVGAIYSSVFTRKEFVLPEGETPVISFMGQTGQNLDVLETRQYDAREEIRRFLGAQNDQIVVIQARPRIFNGGSTRIGQIRDALLRGAYELGVVSRNPNDQIVWITDFPLFKPNTDSEPGQGGSSGLSSTHHPFTAPRMEDIHLLETDPLNVRAEHYDLVVNGVELGGGSARIHDPELQLLILKDIIKIPEERLGQFDHLLTVLGSGCPPHAGIALGFDRLIAVLMETDSVRDVIAFPKNGKGHDPLVRSPTTVQDSQLEPYFLKRA